MKLLKEKWQAISDEILISTLEKMEGDPGGFDVASTLAESIERFGVGAAPLTPESHLLYAHCRMANDVCGEMALRGWLVFKSETDMLFFLKSIWGPLIRRDTEGCESGKQALGLVEKALDLSIHEGRIPHSVTERIIFGGIEEFCEGLLFGKHFNVRDYQAVYAELLDHSEWLDKHGQLGLLYSYDPNEAQSIRQLEWVLKNVVRED